MNKGLEIDWISRFWMTKHPDAKMGYRREQNPLAFALMDCGPKGG